MFMWDFGEVCIFAVMVMGLSISSTNYMSLIILLKKTTEKKKKKNASLEYFMNFKTSTSENHTYAITRYMGISH